MENIRDLHFSQSIGEFGVYLNSLFALFECSGDDSLDRRFENDQQYLEMYELLFVLKSLLISLESSIFLGVGRADSISKGERSSSSEQKVDSKTTTTEVKHSLEKLQLLKSTIRSLHDRIFKRLHNSSTVKEGNPSNFSPRLFRLCRKYQLSEKESEIFHFLVVFMGTRNHLVSLALQADEEMYRRYILMQKITGISETDMEWFMDPERAHVKENIISVDEDQGIHYNLRISRTAAHLLYGRELSRTDDLLKISQTTVERIILDERSSISDFEKSSSSTAVSTMLKSSGSTSPRLLSSSLLKRKASHESITRLKKLKEGSSCSSPRYSDISGGNTDKNSILKRVISVSSDNNGNGNLVKILSRDSDVIEGDDFDEYDNIEIDENVDESFEGDYDRNVDFNGSVGDNSSSLPSLSIPQEADDGSLAAYSTRNQLEYLEEGFQLIALYVRSSSARIKDDMKKEGTRITSSWETGEVKQGRRELQAKIRVAEAKLRYRVEMTRKINVEFVPRLETLAERLQLDSFEKRIVLLLIGKTVSPVVKTLMDTLDSSGMRISDDTISVGQALSILCQDFQSQVSSRPYFYKSSRLLRHGIISLNRSRWHQSNDLTDQKMALDRRVLDYIVGLDSEINELVEGSDLYVPKVSLEEVVLPAATLNLLVTLTTAYRSLGTYLAPENKSPLSSDVSPSDVSPSVDSLHNEIGTSRLSYGSSLVILLYGKPGTGKTMTVNAIAHYLGKKVLMVDFSAMMSRPGDGSSDSEVDLRGLFREANMNDGAVIFFDECEYIFKSRNQGGSDRLLNTLLTEIERHQGLVFLATNRAYDLDEAMHRRITAIVEYRPPDHLMRQKIWRNLLGLSNSTSGVDESPGILGFKSLRLSSDVDVDSLAMKYELTGGFIKNAVISGLLFALHRNASAPVVLQDDLIAGCKLQMRGSLVQRNFESKCDASLGFSQLVVSSSTSNQLQGILGYERARVYHSSHLSSNSSDTATPQSACIVALIGSSGSGKQTVANALAFELNRVVKLVHTADILASRYEDQLQLIQSTVQDARLSDAVIILEGFEHLLEDAVSGGEDRNWKLQLLLARVLDILYQFPGLVCLLCNIEASQHFVFHRDFALKLFAILKFPMPSSDLRSRLWKSFLPSSIELHSDVNFQDLSRRFELHPGSISMAINRAISIAFSQQKSTKSSDKSHSDSGKLVLNQKHFVQAAECENEKFKTGNMEILSKIFS